MSTVASTNTQERETFVAERDLFIDNVWHPATSGDDLQVVDPATEERFGRAAVASAADIDLAVEAARAAFDTGPWPRLSMAERAERLLRLADELEKDIDAITALTVRETGLPTKDGRGGVLAMLGSLRYFARLADGFQAVEARVGNTGVHASIEKHPVGVVAQIVPWNSPIVMAAFNLPPALLAGCAVVLKPSELTPLSAGYLADAALRAGLPAGVLNVVPARGEGADALVRHPGVDKVAFTGSTATGRKVAAAAAGTLKHVALELGGKAAAIVLDDAPLRRIVETMTPAITFNNGQMCMQPGRLLVPAARHDEIVAALVHAFADVVTGPPTAPGTEVGPLISKRQYEHVTDLLRSALDDGGRFAIGGGRPEGLDTGFYIAPTIVTGVSPSSRIAREEVFAPVLVVLPYTTEDEAVAIANDTEFGLNDAVYSADRDRALAIARRLESGNVSINNGQLLDIAIPFGGVKQSGYGRELGPEGLDAYFETRVIVLDGEPFVRLA